MNANPFDGLPLPQVYQGLMSGRFGPRWPSEDLQKGYTGTCGVDLLRRALSFVDILDRDGAFKPGWKGLDYGCGWGRFASALLSKGSPEQLDLCDAWDVTLSHLAQLGYANRVFQVPSLLTPGSVPAATYDLILSFSVFTHLSPRSFDSNIPVLLDALRPGGSLYITVRHDDFITHKYPGRRAEIEAEISRDGIAFLDSGGDLNREKLFGDTIVTPEYLGRFGTVRSLGQPHSLQHVYALARP